MSFFSNCLNLHWAAFFRFLHLITKFNWLHRGDRLRWLTREQELKWQQLMRHTGTQRVRLGCCSNNNSSKQPADSSSDTEGSYRPFSCTLFTFFYTHSEVLYAHGILTVNTKTVRRCSCQTDTGKNQQFSFALWSNLHISPSHPFGRGQKGDGDGGWRGWCGGGTVLTDVHTAWGRMRLWMSPADVFVSRGGLLLWRIWWSLVQVLTRHVLNNQKQRPMQWIHRPVARVKCWHFMICRFRESA